MTTFQVCPGSWCSFWRCCGRALLWLYPCSTVAGLHTYWYRSVSLNIFIC